MLFSCYYFAYILRAIITLRAPLLLFSLLFRRLERCYATMLLRRYELRRCFFAMLMLRRCHAADEGIQADATRR